MGLQKSEDWISWIALFALGSAFILYGTADVVQVVEGQFIYHPPVRIQCRSMAPVPDPVNCTNYYQCFLIPPGMWLQMHFSCPTGGIWDKKYMACVEGTCEGGPITAKPPAAPAPKPTMAKPKPVKPAGTKPKPTTRRPPQQGPAAGSKPKPVTTRKPSILPSQTQTSAPPPGLYKCPSTGQFPHPTDPSKYNICIVYKGRYYYYVHSCPPGACFSRTKRLCTFGKGSC